MPAYVVHTQLYSTVVCAPYHSSSTGMDILALSTRDDVVEAVNNGSDWSEG